MVQQKTGEVNLAGRRRRVKTGKTGRFRAGENGISANNLQRAPFVALEIKSSGSRAQCAVFDPADRQGRQVSGKHRVL
jgi:hypothetical protein